MKEGRKEKVSYRLLFFFFFYGDLIPTQLTEFERNSNLAGQD